MSKNPIQMSSLVEIGPEVVWLRPHRGDPAVAFFRAADGAVKTSRLDALEYEFLECLDGTRSKSDIVTQLSITPERFEALFHSFVSWAPQTLGLRDSDPAVAQKRHNSISAAVELRDIWAAMTAGKDDNAAFHQAGISDPHTQFDTVETTISHAYRVPTTALQNRSYGEAFCDWLLQQDWVGPHARIMEVGCGLGYFANAVLTTLAQKRPDLYDTMTYTMFDLSPELAGAQRQTCAAHLEKILALHGNIETHVFAGEKFDLVISNEVIADLSVAPLHIPEVRSNAPTTEAARLAITYDLALPHMIHGAKSSTLLNVGAIRFVESLGKCLSADGKAILTEYGTLDRSPKAVHFLNHLEFTVQFSHLEQVGQHIGFRTGLHTLGDLLCFDDSYTPLDTASYHILSDAVLPFLGKPALPQIAYTFEMLEAVVGEDMRRVRNLCFRPLSHQQSFSPFRFFALTLER